LGVVDRKVRLTGEEAQLADAFSRHPACGEVGDKTAWELDPGVAEIDLVGQHRDPDGADLGRRLAGHRKSDLQIVNHQIEDHVDVDRPSGKGRQPL
jgi:hypothetical protein